MGNIKDRLLKIVDEKQGGKATVFAKKSGIPPSTFQNYINGRMPHGDHLIRIYETFKVNINWLLTGEGASYYDEESDFNEVGPPVDSMLLREIIEGVEESLTEEHLELEPTKKAALISLLYDYLSETGKKASKKTVNRYLRAVA